MRAVQTVIAVSTLAVPASAYALGGAGTTAGGASTGSGRPAADAPVAAHPTLEIRLRPAEIHLGEAIQVLGSAPAADAGRRVALQTEPALTGGWRTVALGVIARGGRFRFRAGPRRSSLIRVIEPEPVAFAATTTTTTTAASTGSPVTTPAPGTPATASSPVRAVSVRPRFTVPVADRAVLAGGATGLSGRLLPAVAGRVVALQTASAGGWRSLTSARTGARGGFRLRFTPPSGMSGRLRVRFGGDRDNTPATAPAGSATVYEQSVASWYQDGGSTACGFHAGLGVANLSLPCGTRVRFRFGGRSVTAVVDDRGPFVGGREWDLNQATAAALGFGGVGTVWAAVLR
jgi:hypothetical protein